MTIKKLNNIILYITLLPAVLYIVLILLLVASFGDEDAKSLIHSMSEGMKDDD